MKGRSKRFFQLGIVALLVVPQNSCRTPYQQPDGMDLASIDILNYSDYPISQIIYRNAADCTGREEIGDLLQPGERNTANIAAGDATVQVGAASSPLIYTRYGGRSCVMPISFHADRSKRYRLAFRISGDTCSIEFSEVAMNGRATPAAFDEREFSAPLTSAGSFCSERRIHHAGIPASAVPAPPTVTAVSVTPPPGSSCTPEQRELARIARENGYRSSLKCE